MRFSDIVYKGRPAAFVSLILLHEQILNSVCNTEQT